MKSKLLHLILLIFSSGSAFSQTDFYEELADSTLTLTKQYVVYDPSYFRLDYPNGDVPSNRGVCTDVVIRAYRKLGIDLQKEVHEDMVAHFNKYPKNWGLTKTDKNIDHRRVPNLMTFFGRHGSTLPITQNASDYKAGDIVCWNFGGGLTHIGIVSSETTFFSKRPMIIHNMGNGQVLEDMLFDYKIIGHYRYKK
ncbi:DUF1287 domain-containing protein [Flammeovirga sp. EKP202]|uniref:DUF1287 domain-containing protein n=1 Tax=Flammeovirga sp. EKP202 TaxID=2770592 RepID=UPI00165FCFC6|nr:DUF1287 domain-containing protein [Flammeovirga sp. EKP202]MBD0401370.1 DUF1287 domain-containing protein [Flammeovirga sp. EKP202]